MVAGVKRDPREGRRWILLGTATSGKDMGMADRRRPKRAGRRLLWEPSRQPNERGEGGVRRTATSEVGVTAPLHLLQYSVGKEPEQR